MSKAPGSWEQRPLADCGIWLSGGTPSKKNPDYWGGEMPWVGPKDLHERFVDKAEEYLTPEGSANGTKVVPADSILIVVRSMALAKGVQIGLTKREVAFNQDIKAIIPAHDVDSRYLFYALWGKAQQLHHLVDEASHGTKRLSTDVLEDFRIPVPPLPEQRAIAAFVGSLDDKIENNRRVAKTLEEIAATLFKARFVDFVDQDGLVESEVGPMPRNWAVGTLGDLLNQRIERCQPSSDTEKLPYVPIDAISSQSLSLLNSRPGTEARSSLTRFRRGDLLFGAMRPYFHKVCIAPFDGVTRTTVFALQAKPDSFAYAALLLHRPETIDYATRHSTGSTIPYAQWNDSLAAMPVVIPSLDVRKEFNLQAAPLLRRIATSYFLNRSLSQMRDIILPRLISGDMPMHQGDAATA